MELPTPAWVLLLVVGLGLYVAWFLLWRWTESGTQSGLERSRRSERSRDVVIASFALSGLLNIVQDAWLDNTPGRAIRVLVVIAWTGALLSWWLAERSRRNGAASALPRGQGAPPPD